MQPFACSAVLVLVLVHDLVNQLLRLSLALTNIAGVPEILIRLNDHVAPDRTSALLHWLPKISKNMVCERSSCDRAWASSAGLLRMV